MPRVVLRLLPAKPVDGNTFLGYLTGLEITLTDRSFADPAGRDAGHVLGTAEYLVEGDPNATIVQHPDPAIPGLRAPVATAVIELASPLPFTEYDSVDLAFVVRRTVGANPPQTIQVKEVHFNVDVQTGAAPADNAPATYAALGPTAAYVFLPKPLVGLAPGVAFVDIAADGSPPPFAAVLSAMTTVLAADPGAAAAPTLAELTPAQCRHLAWEIVSNRTLDPLPLPSGDLERLYAGGDETARQRFEADLVTFYAVHSTNADVLAKFAYSVAAGTECRARTQQATQVGLTTPVFPGIVPASGAAPVAAVVVSQ